MSKEPRYLLWEGLGLVNRGARPWVPSRHKARWQSLTWKGVTSGLVLALGAKFIKKIRPWRFAFRLRAKKTKCILILTTRSPDFSESRLSLQRNQPFANKETPEYVGKPWLLAPAETSSPSHPAKGFPFAWI